MVVYYNFYHQGSRLFFRFKRNRDFGVLFSYAQFVYVSCLEYEARISVTDVFLLFWLEVLSSSKENVFSVCKENER